MYKANEVGDAQLRFGDDDSDSEAVHEASEVGDAANALFGLYEASEASEVNEVDKEDALFQLRDNNSDIEAVREAVDMDIDKAEAESQSEGELLSDVYDSSKDTDSTTNSDDSHREVDDAASVSLYKTAEDEDTLYEASKPGPEAQLQQELQQSKDAELNLPLQLGLHLLNSFSCDGHADSYKQHQDTQEEENHWLLEDLNQATQRLPDILSSPSILPHNSEYRQRLYDWARLFEGCLNKHTSADESSLDESSSDSDNSSSKPATVCLACIGRRWYRPWKR